VNAVTVEGTTDTNGELIIAGLEAGLIPLQQRAGVSSIICRIQKIDIFLH